MRTLMLIFLRHVTDYVQAGLSNGLCKICDVIALATESSIVLCGTAKSSKRKLSSGGHKLLLDYWELNGLSPPGGANNISMENH